jgi:hypothetical protein
MKSILLVVILLNWFNVFCQKDTLIPYLENRLEKSLKPLRSSISDEDKRNANNSFRVQLLETIQYSESFLYLFPKLSTLGAIISPDKSLKIYSWNVEMSDKSNKFYCFVVRPGKRRKKNKVVEFSKILTWDKKRFDSLIERGWIATFRAKHPGSKPLYELSLKGQRMVASIYNILNGEEIPTASMYNPLFKSTASHGDKLFANAIKEMNESIKQQRLLLRESRYSAHR